MILLQMISLSLLLLFFNGWVSTTARYRRYIRVKEFKDTADQLRTWYQKTANTPSDKGCEQNTPKTVNQPSEEGCKQAAKQMKGDPNTRSLAPWKYRIDRDDNRFPREIAVAECLCQGCIINQRLNHDYNSVPVYAPLIVLTKTCGSDKYALRSDILWIPVACTCVAPK